MRNKESTLPGLNNNIGSMLVLFFRHVLNAQFKMYHLLTYFPGSIGLAWAAKMIRLWSYGLVIAMA